MRYTTRPPRSILVQLALLLSIVVSSGFARAQGGEGELLFQLSPSAWHFGSSPDYKGTPWLVGIEYTRKDDWLFGYSYFNNSFDQRSNYAYGGRVWRLGSADAASSYWYTKLTGGVILGYRDPFEDKIPFNHNGIAPGIVPGLGYRAGAFNAQLNLLGTSGLMLTFGYARPF